MATENFRFPKTERLRGERTITSLFEQGQSGFVYPFRYVYQLSGDAPQGGVAVLVTVPKRNHKRANRRNLLKRRTREAYRLNKHPLAATAATAGKSAQLALVYTAKEEASYAEVEKAVRRILAAVGEKF